MLAGRRFRMVEALAAAALGLALLSGPAFASNNVQQASGKLVKIGHDGICLDWNQVFNTCAQGVGTEKWNEVAATGGTYKFEFTREPSTRCLDGSFWPRFGDTVCAAGDGAQRWTLVASTGGTYKIEQDEHGTTICLDDTTYGTNNDTFHACAQGNGEQRWTINSAS
jgi:hypothetical protein